MGAFTMSLLFGKIADATHNFNQPLFMVAAVMISGGLTWLLIDPTRQLHIEPEKEYSI